MSKNRVIPLGIVLGVVLLGLMAVFAIAVPKLHKDNGTIALPDTLPGGYTATDLPGAFKNAPAGSEAQVKSLLKSEKASVAYGDKALKAAYGAGQTRTYLHLTSSVQESVIVQAFHSSGGSFAPLAISDPKNAQQGAEVDNLLTADGVVCDQHLAPDQQTGAPQTAYFECQKSEDGLTVQVTSQSKSLSDAVRMTNTVYKEVA